MPDIQAAWLRASLPLCLLGVLATEGESYGYALIQRLGEAGLGASRRPPSTRPWANWRKRAPSRCGGARETAGRGGSTTTSPPPDTLGSHGNTSPGGPWTTW